MFKRLVTSKSKKALLASLRNVSLLVSVTAITACSSLPETVIGVSDRHYGYAPEDPCIRCGESWVNLPNEEMAALNHPSNQKPDEYWHSKLEEMYGPNWLEVTPNWSNK